MNHPAPIGYRVREHAELALEQAPDGPSRLLIDPDGRRWRVWEHVAERPTCGADDREVRSLVFDGGMVIRRLAAYPRRWYALDDAALLALGAMA